jgi:hypothetical protein
MKVSGSQNLKLFANTKVDQTQGTRNNFEDVVCFNF